MPGIKILDKNTSGARRRPRLWECFGRINLYPTNIKDARGAYYAIIGNEQIETILNEEAKKVFREEGFDILPP